MIGKWPPEEFEGLRKEVRHGNNPRPRVLESGLTAALIFLALLFHATYVTRMVEKRVTTKEPEVKGLSADGQAENVSYPDVFIYRRTKKTGSASMYEALVKSLRPKGYEVLDRPDSVRDLLKAEALQPGHRRVLILTHNYASRVHTTGMTTVIADTIKDGFRQMTSYCRFCQKIEKCDEQIIKCFQTSDAQSQKRYRWAGAESEDASTYIDLPLSSAHPGLSTTVFRRVFPDVTLDITLRNVVGSACAETKELREAYDRYFAGYDAQIDTLRRRLLALAGYPVRRPDQNATIADLLDAAEVIERKKYSFGKHEPSRGKSELGKEIGRARPKWTRSESGELRLVS